MGLRFRLSHDALRGVFGCMVAWLVVLSVANSLTNARMGAVARAAEPPAREASRPTCKLTISLVNARTGDALPGIVRIVDTEGRGVELPELINRGQGIEQRGPIHDWWVLPARSEVTVPAAALRVKALSGLETDLAEERVDLTGKTQATLEVPLVRFYRARERGYLAGNTHLHLMKLSKQQADRYLQQVPLADGLDVVFLSYLERAGADLDYTSNKYTRREARTVVARASANGARARASPQFWLARRGLWPHLAVGHSVYHSASEHRPGHYRRGGRRAAAASRDRRGAAGRRQGHLAHNLFGFEDIPNWVTGRVHANNIFDGSARGSYKDTYYHYLNIGLRVPFSSGTDWFIYDFSRVYVTSDRAITPTEWLQRLADGKTFITNGPLVELTIDERPVGSVIELEKPREVKVRGRAIGRVDFKRIELVQNGRVTRTAKCEKDGAHFVATLDESLPIDTPAWLALRTPPPPVQEDAELQEPVAENEFGGALFAHSSPIYVNVAKQGVFDRATAASLVAQMKSDWGKIQAQAVFDNQSQRKRVEQVYDEAIGVLEKKLAAEAR